MFLLKPHSLHFRAWEKEQARAKVKDNPPRFWKALFNVHKAAFLIFLAIIAVDELFIRYYIILKHSKFIV
jgi:hypothetical protein